MFALPAGLQLGWLLYERARALTGAASHIRGWIALLLADVDGEVRLLLEQLVHRVDALTPALSYALAWASDKGSAVADVVFTAKEALFRIETFIEACALQQGQVALLDRDWLIRHLQQHLRELDFSIASVTLAVSLVTASRPSQPQCAVLSASALLRASERLQSMHDTGGDVTLSFGALYALRQRSGAAPDGAGDDGDDGIERTAEPRSTELHMPELRSRVPLDASAFLTDHDHFSAGDSGRESEAARGPSAGPPLWEDAAPTSDVRPAASLTRSATVQPPSPPDRGIRAHTDAAVSDGDDKKQWADGSNTAKSEELRREAANTSSSGAAPTSSSSSSSSSSASSSPQWERMSVASLHGCYPGHARGHS